MEFVLEIISAPSMGLRKTKNLSLVFLRHIKDHFVPHARNNYHPHVFGHTTLALFSGLLVAVKIFVLVLVSVGPALPAFSSAITNANIISLTNSSRLEYNLPILAESSILNAAAQAKADHMLSGGYFSHTSPDGKTPWSFIQSAGYNYIMAGENLAVNFSQAENVEEAWMNSPGHKANILNKNFEEIGVGIAQGEYQGHTAIFVVQMFGTPVEQRIILSDEPTKVQVQTVPQPTYDVKVSGSNVLADSQILQDISITGEDVSLEGDNIIIRANISQGATKVVANFGAKAIMLAPKLENVWEGQVALEDLAQGTVSVNLQAYDITGKTYQKQLADFAGSTIENYNVVGSDNKVKSQWLGITFDAKVFENKFFLIFIAALLSCLALSIAIHRHIQHLPLIANGSFVIILAVCLWMMG